MVARTAATKDAAGAGTGLAGDGRRWHGDGWCAAAPSPRSPQLPDGARPRERPAPRSAQDPADGALDLGNRGSPPKSKSMASTSSSSSGSPSPGQPPPRRRRVNRPWAPARVRRPPGNRGPARRPGAAARATARPAARRRPSGLVRAADCWSETPSARSGSRGLPPGRAAQPLLQVFSWAVRAGGWPAPPAALAARSGDSAQDLGDELSERSRGDAFGGGGGAGTPNLLGAMAPFSWSASGSFVPACQREMDRAAAFGTRAAAAAGVAGARGGASASGRDPRRRHRRRRRVGRRHRRPHLLPRFDLGLVDRFRLRRVRVVQRKLCSAGVGRQSSLHPKPHTTHDDGRRTRHVLRYE